MSDGVFELSDVRSYTSNMWNVMDWLNYSVFFVSFMNFRRVFALYAESNSANPPCALLCETVGYVDEWQLFGTMRKAKYYLSLCVCVQLLKVTKFAIEAVPKMGLAPLVLKRALPDITFHSAVFIVSMVAFVSGCCIRVPPHKSPLSLSPWPPRHTATTHPHSHTTRAHTG